MVNALPEAAERVRAAAEAAGLAISIVIMPATTRTAEEAAAACSCTVGQIVKSLVFRGETTGRPLLLLVSGANRVNEAAVAEPIGEAIARADADFARAATGFAIGGISPFGHATPLTPYIDADLMQYETVWAAAGTPNAVFAANPAALRLATGGVVISVK